VTHVLVVEEDEISSLSTADDSNDTAEKETGDDEQPDNDAEQQDADFVPDNERIDGSEPNSEDDDEDGASGGADLSKREKGRIRSAKWRKNKSFVKPLRVIAQQNWLTWCDDSKDARQAPSSVSMQVLVIGRMQQPLV